MSSSEPRSTAVPKYFTGTAVKGGTGGAIATMVFGGVLILVGLIVTASSDSGSAAGLVCIGGIGLLFLIMGWVNLSGINSKYAKEVERTEPKPSDAQMDGWLATDKTRIIGEAMSKLDLPPDSVINANDPLVVIGPATGSKIKSGDDGIFRFSKYEIVIIYLTDYHLGAYSCDLDFVTGNVTQEQTQEYHYTDVVSVATLTSNSTFQVETMDGKSHPIASSQEFSLSVASGQSIRVAVAFPQVPDILRNGRLAATGADKAISTMRAMLREKKGGAAHS